MEERVLCVCVYGCVCVRLRSRRQMGRGLRRTTVCVCVCVCVCIHTCVGLRPLSFISSHNLTASSSRRLWPQALMAAE